MSVATVQFGLCEALAGWVASRFERFTDIQRTALPHTLAGENTLILAPTGSGKTLAAFLSVLDRLAQEAPALPNATRAVYVSPLRSLTLDIRRNLEPPLAALNAGLPEADRIRMEVRTGDTAQPDRTRQQRRRPHLLLTTPESLNTLLSQSGWSDGLDPHTVIVDEIHALVENKRGSLLSLALERLEARVEHPVQRIGLSATASPVSAVKNLLCGRRVCTVASVDVAKAHRLEIAEPDPRAALPAAGFNPYRTAYSVARAVKNAQTSLIFTTTRSAAERLALAVEILLPEWEEHIAVHHGSIDRAERERVEQGLVEGTLKAVVCSSTLELGVDFSSVDQVILIGAPRGVSLAVQRLGRSGHRVDGIASGLLAPLSLADLLECVAIRQAVAQGRLDELRVPAAPLDVLAQALLGMSIEKPWTPNAAYRLVRRAGPYRKLSRKDFDDVLEYLAGGGKVLGPYGTYGKIVFRSGRFEVASKRTARDYYRNAGTITDDYQVRLYGRNNRRLGSVEENFLSDLKPGEGFIIGGKAVRIKRWEGDTALVEPAQGEHIKTPRWSGGKMNLSVRLASEELKLRRALRSAWKRGRAKACMRTLIEQWHIAPGVAAVIGDYLTRQNRAAPIPVDKPVQIERLHRGRSLTYIFHSIAGRAVNRSLAWVTAHRLGLDASIVGSHDDHAFLLSFGVDEGPSEEDLRPVFRAAGFRDDLQTVVASTATLGKSFRAVAEIGQLLPRRTVRGRVRPRAATWSADLLYQTFREHEPDHPLAREAVRQVVEDQLDAERATAEAERIGNTPWEIIDLQRASPFALPLYAVLNREVLMAGNPDRALEEMANEMYDEWKEAK